ARGRGTMSRRIARIEAERRRARRRRILVRAAQIGIPVIAIGAGLIIFLVTRGGGNQSATANTDISKSTVSTPSTEVPPSTRATITPTVTSCDQATGTITDTTGGAKPQFPTQPVFTIDPSHVFRASVETTTGTIVIELSPSIAPITVNNFVFLARCGFYDKTIIHRVAKDFVIQGGDPTGTGTG